MPSMNIKKVPVRLYLKLKKSATENRRSLNSETIFRLEQALGLRALDPVVPARAARKTKK